MSLPIGLGPACSMAMQHSVMAMLHYVNRMLRRPCTRAGLGARGGHQQELRAVGLQEKKGNTSEKASPRDDSHGAFYVHVSQEEPFGRVARGRFRVPPGGSQR
jgi:hypothetical protein